MNPFRKYLIQTVVGSIASELGRQFIEQRKDSKALEPIHESMQPKPELSKTDLFGKANDRLEKRQDTILSHTQPEQFVKGMNPENWEVPIHIKRAATLGKYMYSVPDKEKMEDGSHAVKEKVFKEIKETPKKILELPDKLRKAHSIKKGIEKEGMDNVEQRLQNHMSLETANTVGQFGFNMMAKGFTQLIPGIPGFIARSYMNAKTVGNLGYSINEAYRATGKEDGIIMKTVNARLESSKETKSK